MAPPVHRHLRRFARALIGHKPGSPKRRKRRREWSIGLYTGPSPFALAPCHEITNPVLTRLDVTDRAARFVADPFMVRERNVWHMFFEVLDETEKKGVIGLATSTDGRRWTYERTVLAEDYHLSYPYIFKWADDYYMIPETYQASSIRLYRAAHFPARWSLVGDLLTGGVFLDSSIFRHAGRWWIFTETNPEHKWDTLRLFHCADLLGSWSEHPMSPIVRGNPHHARPGGRVVVRDGMPVRFAQDCAPDYGRQVWAFQITDLTTQSYKERLIEANPVLAATGDGWNSSGMHTVDAHRLKHGDWIACVDGLRVYSFTPDSHEA